MTDSTPSTAPLGTLVRVGVVMAPMPEKMSRALRYLVLLMNAQQKVLQFEMQPVPGNDVLLRGLGPDGDPFWREEVRPWAREAVGRWREHGEKEAAECEAAGDVPPRVVVLSMARLNEGYYGTRGGEDVYVMALASGNG